MFYLLIPIEDVLRSACTASDTSVKASCTFDVCHASNFNSAAATTILATAARTIIQSRLPIFMF